jgi:four helix bundle protein
MPERIDAYRDLKVWQQALDLAVATYDLTRNWPKEEIYGLTAQARLAATSVQPTLRKGSAAKTAAPISNSCVSPKAR